MIPIIFFLPKNENSKNGEVKFFDLIYAFCHSTKFTHTTLNKIEFDGKKYRTTRINDVLRGVLQIDKGLAKNKKGQISKNRSLSRVLEPKGVKSDYFGEDLSELNQI